MRRERGAAVGDEMKRAEDLRRVRWLARPQVLDEALDNSRDRIQSGRPELTARGEYEAGRELLVRVGEEERPAARVQIEHKVRHEAHDVEVWRKAGGARILDVGCKALWYRLQAGVRKP